MIRKCLLSGMVDAMRDGISDRLINDVDSRIHHRSTRDNDMKIGIYLCSCDGCVSGILDLKTIADGVKHLKSVKKVEIVNHLCSKQSIRTLKKDAERNALNRIVIGACSPRTYFRHFQGELSQNGENGIIIEMANIREQCAWIHWDDPLAATEKASTMISMAVAKLRATSMSEKGYKAVVDEDICDGCGICASVCRIKAISIINDPQRSGKKIASVNENICDGCGACVASCPSGALDQSSFSNKQILAQIEAATTGRIIDDLSSPNILVFACNWCSYAAADLAGLKKLNLPPNFFTIRTMCSARIDPEWVLSAFSKGIDGVLVLPGKLGHCHYEIGNLRTTRRIALLRRVLSQLGFDEMRLMLGFVDAEDAEEYQHEVSSFISTIRSIGPNPLRDFELSRKRR